jgi:glycosyltransferase involved in cell wall biosynthesis
LSAEPPRISSRPGLSACIIAMDEEDRIGDCIDSLAFCDEILVVDSHSRDRTRELAAQRGARVLERDWPGHVAQKEFAIRAARNDWVLCVDADERISAPLRAEIETLRVAGFPEKAGWRMSRLSSYLGRWMRRGAWVPDWQLRLFDRRRGRWGGHDPHDHVETDGPVGVLRGPLLHHPYRDLAEHLRTIDRYTTIMAEGMHGRGVRASPFDLLVRPASRFLRAYVVKLGFLEGWRGFLQACLAAHYGRMKYAKLLVLQHGEATRKRPT